MQGGPSHIDTFDPKPDAPVEVRGEFGTIPTTLPGVRFAEHLPLLAKQTDKFGIIRGHDPQNGSHGVADHLMMSGHKFNPSLPFPCFGSVVAKERGYVDGMFPFVQLGRNIDRRFNGGIAGFLGDEFNPFEVHETRAQPRVRGPRPVASPATPSGSGSTAATRCSPSWKRTRRASSSRPSVGEGPRRVLREGARPHHVARRRRRRSTSPPSRTGSASGTADARSASRACSPAG